MRHRSAVLVGFSRSLQDAIGDLIARGGMSVHPVGTPEEAMAYSSAEGLPDLVVVAGRCAPPEVVELVEALGNPREARVVVLLSRPDAETEAGYRDAGLKFVLTMPVTLHQLLAAGGVE